MEKYNRAERRFHLRRMKKRAVEVYGRYEGRYFPQVDVHRHEILANHIAHCSGPCCGNPRRWFGDRTMQERRFLAEPVEEYT